MRNKRFIPLCLCFIAIFPVTAFAYKLAADYNENLKILINNKPFIAYETPNTELPPILYNNRTYLPIRPILEEVNIFISYDNENQRVEIKNENTLLSRGNLVLHCLKYQDMEQLSSLVHPTKGVTLSPYAYIENYHLNFQQDYFSHFSDDEIYIWDYEISASPIELNFLDFINTYIYSKDFINADRIGNNMVIQRSTANINVSDYFNDVKFIEYNFTSTEIDADGIDWTGDWQSIRLYFENCSEQWYLVAITHDGFL